MAKGFKKQLQGGGFQNLSISGSAQLQNMRLQSDIEINALKQQQARQKQLDESQLTDLRRSYKTEQANRDSIQKLEVNRQKLELENQQLMAKRDIENKRLPNGSLLHLGICRLIRSTSRYGHQSCHRACGQRSN